MAADALGIPQVSAVLAQLIAFIPSIIAAILILVLAALLANFVSGIVRGATGSSIRASVVQYAIIVYAVFAAITELGIAVKADGSYVPDPAWRGGFGCCDSLRDRGPGGSPRDPSEDL